MPFVLQDVDRGRIIVLACEQNSHSGRELNLPGINTDYSYTSGRHYPQTTFQLYQYDASKNDAVQLRDDVPSNPIPSNS